AQGHDIWTYTVRHCGRSRKAVSGGRPSRGLRHAAHHRGNEPEGLCDRYSASLRGRDEKPGVPAGARRHHRMSGGPAEGTRGGAARVGGPRGGGCGNVQVGAGGDGGDELCGQGDRARPRAPRPLPRRKVRGLSPHARRLSGLSKTNAKNLNRHSPGLTAKASRAVKPRNYQTKGEYEKENP